MEFKGNNLKVSGVLKAKTIDKCLDFVSSDLRPYDSIAGDGFIQLTRQHTAATIGRYDVRDILPHPTTVSRHVEDRAH